LQLDDDIYGQTSTQHYPHLAPTKVIKFKFTLKIPPKTVLNKQRRYIGVWFCVRVWNSFPSHTVIYKLIKFTGMDFHAVVLKKLVQKCTDTYIYIYIYIYIYMFHKSNICQLAAEYETGQN
jgi:hypothetical protein